MEITKASLAEAQGKLKAVMDKIAELGGAVAAIENGFQKSEIERSAYRIANEIDAGELEKHSGIISHSKKFALLLHRYR